MINKDMVNKSFLGTDGKDGQFAKVLDRYYLCRRESAMVFSDFLDPESTEKFLRIFKQDRDVQALAFGGFADAERKIIGFAPAGFDLDGEDFPIAALTLRYNEKFSDPPAHRDYLGAVLGLGLDRAKVGDICLTRGGAVLFIAADLAGYAAANLDKAGRVKLNVTMGAAETPRENGAEIRLTVASLRLDVVTSAAFNISRKKSAALIEGEKVFINWSLVSNSAKPVAEGDVITVRGLGRVKFSRLDGKTKKGRFGLVIIK
ncbi:MAG: hypothetical protein LBS62_01490 [Clostridiales bacterium]|jgi:RNA-binding protein YlmH|nr:hypothetical protein [Clostridiales bacterium]